MPIVVSYSSGTHRNSFHLGKGVLEVTSTNVCGFMHAAAARTSLLIARHQPEVVLLAGIAGSLDRNA